jgi:hypothetical protein
MQRTTVTLVVAQVLIDALLDTLTARPAAALLTTPTLGLLIAPSNPTPSSVYAGMTPPVFHGYTPAAITLVGPVNVSPTTEGLVATANFIATACGTIADTVIGYWLSDGAANFYAGELFATAVPFANPGDFLTVNFVFPMPELIPNA